LCTDRKLIGALIICSLSEKSNFTSECSMTSHGCNASVDIGV
jgi:hypothetical protein